MPRNRNAKTNNKILRKDIDNLKTMDFLNKEESIRTPIVRKCTKKDNHKSVIYIRKNNVDQNWEKLMFPNSYFYVNDLLRLVYK